MCAMGKRFDDEGLHKGSVENFGTDPLSLPSPGKILFISLSRRKYDASPARLASYFIEKHHFY